MRLAVNLGMTLGPTVGGFLALRDYGWLFVADGVTCLLATGLLLFAFPGRPLRTVPRIREAAAAKSASVVSQSRTSSRS